MQGRTPLAAAVEQGKGHAALLLQTLGTKNDRFLYYDHRFCPQTF
jgi:hypothetical protein